MLSRQGCDPPKCPCANILVAKGGHPGGHVEWQIGRAVVQVGLVHGEEVNVMEDGAGVVEIPQSLSKANIEQHSRLKGNESVWLTM